MSFTVVDEVVPHFAILSFLPFFLFIFIFFSYCHGNTAVLEGHDIFIYSLKMCRKLKLQPDRSLPKNFVTNQGSVRHESALTSTVTNYLVFDGADTSCMKPIERITWVLKNKNSKQSTLHLLHR